LSKRTLIEIAGVLALTLLIGVFFNLSSPNRIQFIGDDKPVDFSQSDSLLRTMKIQDSLLKAADSIKMLSNKRDDSLKAAIANEKRIKDSLNIVRQDSIKHVQDSLKAVKEKLKDSVDLTDNKNQNNQNFVKPVDIRIDFAKALFDKKYRFVDARDISDYQAGHIQGAMNIPYHDLEKYREVLNGLPKDQVYVCYCSSACDVSIDLAYAMAKMGFTKLYIFHGGWDEWKAAGYPAN
jgi:rhodanese-related sulfurtransferase